jgi:hypothetical protein
MLTTTSIYEAIGVKPVINARGHNTVLGGSTPSPRVKAAMDQADRYFVDMAALLDRAGQIIAGLLGADARSDPGAAGVLARHRRPHHRRQPDLMARLPDTTGPKGGSSSRPAIATPTSGRPPCRRHWSRSATPAATAARPRRCSGRTRPRPHPAHLEGRTGTSLDGSSPSPTAAAPVLATPPARSTRSRI